MKTFGQGKLDTIVSNDICNCLDSLKQQQGLYQASFVSCFELAVEKNQTAFMQQCLLQYGDTTFETGNKCGKEFAERISISLVNSCRTYFIITDSLRYGDYKNLNKDSLRDKIQELETIETARRNSEYFDNRGLIYFKLGQYDSAFNDVNTVLQEDPNNVKNLFLKAWINEIKGNYDEAIKFYRKATDLSQIKAFGIFTEIAKRKKKGL